MEPINDSQDHIVHLTLTYAAPGETYEPVATADLHTDSQDAADSVVAALARILVGGAQKAHVTSESGETLFYGNRETGEVVDSLFDIEEVA